MRKWHRWAAIPAGVFLFFMALTGVLLHVDMMRLGQSPPGHDIPGSKSALPIPNDAELAAMIGRAANAAREEDTVVFKSIKVDLSAPRAIVIAEPIGPTNSQQIKLDAITGARIIDPASPADFHYVLQDLHAGYFFGWTGRILSLISGLAVIVLTVTGLQIWWNMRRRGKKGIYWS
jgi:uncharacterized iron-regulated membrane protein